MREKFLGEVEIVNAPRDHVRRDMNLDVVAAFNGLPCGVGNLDWCSSGFYSHDGVVL